MNDIEQTIEERLDTLARLANTVREDKRIVVPKNDRFTRSDVVNAFTTAFEMIGGISRLALWAHENPTDFYKLYSKLLPSTNMTLVQQLPDDMRRLSTAELEAIVQEYQAEPDTEITDVEFTHVTH
jgi:SpoVK/Ycf46/Vps4 family AAA+-type ATPase